jgi:3-keto-disaccharide hydrolase
MRCCGASAVVLTIASISFAADKPHALAAKEIADGWIMLFDGESTFGWKAEGEAKVTDGVLKIGGEKAGTLTSTSEFARGDVVWSFRQKGLNQATMTWRGEERKLSANNNWVKETYEPGALGCSAIKLHVPMGTELEIRAFWFRPLLLEPLFNGADLSGWKKFTADHRSKSNFTVTNEGWLNVKDGPGDLQTEKQFDDFVLQLECISNGKHLNSGIFFRCIPGDYQNGYEAQIQNGFKDNDRSKPTDAGTGAIYRRQAARKVVPNDFEWFSMTLMARGNHMATWVNGYQVTDFTDTRPANDNPRNGSKVGKGPISIQGHDRTTDLSFRNIRIVAIEKK